MRRTGDLPGPGWLGLGWVGSGVNGGAALGVVVGVAAGQLLSHLSDRTTDSEARPEVGPVLGAVVGVVTVLPLGVLVGLLVGLALRSLAGVGAVTAWRSAATGLVVGVLVVAAATAVLFVGTDLDTPSRLLAAAALPAAVAGLAGAVLALLMWRSAARLEAWPR